jgi:hypothetical protein
VAMSAASRHPSVAKPMVMASRNMAFTIVPP